MNKERYTRNIIIDKIGIKGQEKLLNSKVLVVGAGGLSSTVLLNLAALGIGVIGIVDKDKLELSNLNRQYVHSFENLGKVKVESAKERILKFNPDTTVKTYPVFLDETNYSKIVKNYDIIIDCTDSYKSKFLLNKISLLTNTPLIHGAVTEFQGQIMTILPHKSACLKCLVGDVDESMYNVKGVISPVVSTIASFQALEAVKLILQIGENLTNKVMFFNALNMSTKIVKIPQNKSCECFLEAKAK